MMLKATKTNGIFRCFFYCFGIFGLKYFLLKFSHAIKKGNANSKQYL